MPSDRLLSTDPKAGVLLSSDPNAAQAPSPATPPAASGVMSDEDWAKLPPGEKMRNVLRWAGGAISGMAFGSAGRELLQDAEEHPYMTAATMLLPSGVKAARGVIPSTVRAGSKFESVMSATRSVPIDISKPGAAALRIQELADRGGSMPMAARKFLNRITDPNKGPMAFEEGRDFYHNVSRLSADEMRRLAPKVRREVGNLRVALNESLENAAKQTGKLTEYRSAMKEYARASTLKAGAKKTAKTIKKAAVPSGFALYAYEKLSDLLRTP